jgi:hypothetical protein
MTTVEHWAVFNVGVTHFDLPVWDLKGKGKALPLQAWTGLEGG